MVARPEAVVGLPFKLEPRVDFDSGDFAKLVERSPRLVWERSAICPCVEANTQTKQSDPNCALCKGLGYYWFGPVGYALTQEVIEVVGPLTLVQRAVQARRGGAIIRGFFSQATMVQDGFDRLGTWFWGQMRVTVRPENLLGYYDRLINLDDEIVFSEVVTVPGEASSLVGAETLSLRYPAIRVFNIQSTTTRYRQGAHFRLDGNGDILWLGGVQPARNTRVAVHYSCHSTWVVTSYPHVIRASTVRGKKPRRRRPDAPLSPPPVPQPLPLHADVRLEFERDRE